MLDSYVMRVRLGFTADAGVIEFSRVRRIGEVESAKKRIVMSQKQPLHAANSRGLVGQPSRSWAGRCRPGNCSPYT
jgi:hypothetical protein